MERKGTTSPSIDENSVFKCGHRFKGWCEYLMFQSSTYIAFQNYGSWINTSWICGCRFKTLVPQAALKTLILQQLMYIQKHKWKKKKIRNEDIKDPFKHFQKQNHTSSTLRNKYEERNLPVQNLQIRWSFGRSLSFKSHAIFASSLSPPRKRRPTMM